MIKTEEIQYRFIKKRFLSMIKKGEIQYIDLLKKGSSLSLRQRKIHHRFIKKVPLDD